VNEKNKPHKKFKIDPARLTNILWTDSLIIAKTIISKKYLSNVLSEGNPERA
jgi:hypothetical protein